MYNYNYQDNTEATRMIGYEDNTSHMGYSSMVREDANGAGYEALVGEYERLINAGAINFDVDNYTSAEEQAYSMADWHIKHRLESLLTEWR